MKSAPPIFPHEDKGSNFAEQAPLPTELAKLVPYIYMRISGMKDVDDRGINQMYQAALKYCRGLAAMQADNWQRLDDKQVFNHIVSQLGYQAPQSFLWEDGTTPNRDELNNFLNNLPNDRVLLKPHSGSNGRDIVRKQRIGLQRGINRLKERHYQAVTSLSQIIKHKTWVGVFEKGYIPDQSYLIQEEVPLETEYRYFGYRMLDGKSYRIAFEKTIPSVISNGWPLIVQMLTNKTLRKNTLWDFMLQTIEGMPDEFIERQKGGLFGYVPQGEKIPLVNSGNISAGAQNQVIPAEQMNNLDTFMARFIHELEGNIGERLDYFCFDIGSKVESVLCKDYDFETLRAALCFFEFQTVSGFGAYPKILKAIEEDPAIANGFENSCAIDTMLRAQEKWPELFARSKILAEKHDFDPPKVKRKRRYY